MAIRAPALLKVTERVYLPRLWSSAAFAPVARLLSDFDLAVRSVVFNCSSSFTWPDLSIAGDDRTSALLGLELLPEADARCRRSCLFGLPGRSCTVPS